MIASALRDFLVTVSKHELMTGTGLRLLSDLCYGQNKNTNVLSMLTAFRKQQCPHLTITNVFPVRGHSFLPADGVFRRIEQDIPEQPKIVLSEECSSQAPPGLAELP